MRLVSVNANGIRAAVRRGGAQALLALQPDVVAVQETRASDEQLDTALAGTDLSQWHRLHLPGGAGRAGVALLSHSAPLAVTGEIMSSRFPGRWVSARYDVAGLPVEVASVYVHTGEVGSAMQKDKLAFLDAIGEHMRRSAEEGIAGLVAGDLNVAHTQLDIKNWMGNRGKSGFLPEEQERLTDWSRAGWVDVARHLAGDTPGPYTWWSWRGRAFDNDAGWRIDYVWACPRIAPCVTGVTVARAASYDLRWSDHAPLVVDLTLSAV